MVNVVVDGSDAVACRTLELLLERADYQVGFVDRSCLGEPGGLEGTDLFVLKPGLTEKQEATSLATFVAGSCGVVRVPAVELVPNLREATSAVSSHGLKEQRS